MENILSKVFIPKMGVVCYVVGDCESFVDGDGVHFAIRVYKTTAHPSSTFRVKVSDTIQVKA